MSRDDIPESRQVELKSLTRFWINLEVNKRISYMFGKEKYILYTVQRYVSRN